MAVVIKTRTGVGTPANGALAEGELGVDPSAAALYVGDAGGGAPVPLTGAAALPPNVVTGTPNGTKIEIVATLPVPQDANTIYFVTA